ncbi:low molecular weight phosphotyrosine protein phosphatase [Flavobacteriaceae bacterium TP-CH-4]|uniref:protein-tyrosine-phosphatase n=1 Tax=Pelagihabitans pacificus TaxID=2696054 RepID=A0A967AS24_9FLAO|nr:low molecular weight protein-tyrosine-phosphatase [Pelagihabitans pacificus]NHF59324.1 low molecular weight phosphotyrosine protein phosphatase [Pelagihabitans pacificus]
MATKVLMVCLGNICRSPLAEGLLQSKVDPELVSVDSAGTGGYHIGERPDERSIAVAAKYGLDISRQRCRKLTRRDLDIFDLIFAMDRSNFQNILELAETKAQVAKVRLLLESVDLGTNEVPDPYYGGKDGFEHVYMLIDVACDHIAKQLENKN